MIKSNQKVKSILEVYLGHNAIKYVFINFGCLYEVTYDRILSFIVTVYSFIFKTEILIVSNQLFLDFAAHLTCSGKILQ